MHTLGAGTPTILSGYGLYLKWKNALKLLVKFTLAVMAIMAVFTSCIHLLTKGNLDSAEYCLIILLLSFISGINK